jgi:hypothetical protein
MGYTKYANNTYARNNSESYNRSVFKPTQRFYMNSNVSSYPNFSNKDVVHQNKILLTGGDASGSVWINSGYDVSELSPGLSWIN